MTAAALAAVSAMTGALANLLARRINRFAPTRDFLAANFALMFILLLPAAPFFWRLELRLEAVAILITAALIDLAANYFYFRSFEALDAVTASSVLALSPAIALFFVPLFRFGQELPFSGYAGILLVSIGLIVLSRAAAPEGGAARLTVPRAIWLPFAAALFYGVNVFVIKLLFTNNYTNPYTYYLLRALIVAVVWYFVFRPSHSWFTRSALLFTAGRLIVVIAQWMALLAALNLGNPASVKALADSSPLFVLVFSGLITRERVRPMQAVGALIVVAGMTLVALAGG